MGGLSDQGVENKSDSAVAVTVTTRGSRRGQHLLLFCPRLRGGASGVSGCSPTRKPRGPIRRTGRGVVWGAWAPARRRVPPGGCRLYRDVSGVSGHQSISFVCFHRRRRKKRRTRERKIKANPSRVVAGQERRRAMHRRPPPAYVTIRPVLSGPMYIHDPVHGHREMLSELNAYSPQFTLTCTVHAQSAVYHSTFPSPASCIMRPLHQHIPSTPSAQYPSSHRALAPILCHSLAQSQARLNLRV